MTGKSKNAKPSKRQSIPTKVARRFKRTRADHASELAEDYVELIDDLIRENGEARAVDIAVRLGVSHVTVTRAVGRLQRDGWATSEPYRSIFLTDEGKKLAEAMRKRHALVFKFLLAIGVPNKDAEIDAEGIEHHLSPPTMEAIRRFLRRRR